MKKNPSFILFDFIKIVMSCFYLFNITLVYSFTFEVSKGHIYFHDENCQQLASRVHDVAILSDKIEPNHQYLKRFLAQKICDNKKPFTGSVDVTPFISKKVLGLLTNEKISCDGPNCWDVPLYLFQEKGAVRFVGLNEFQTFLESHCHLRENGSAIDAGDVIVFKKVEENSGGQQSTIVHAAVTFSSFFVGPQDSAHKVTQDLQKILTFTKNGDVDLHLHCMMTLDKVKKEYEEACLTDKTLSSIQLEFYQCSASKRDAESKVIYSHQKEIQKIEQTISGILLRKKRITLSELTHLIKSYNKVVQNYRYDFKRGTNSELKLKEAYQLESIFGQIRSFFGQLSSDRMADNSIDFNLTLSNGTKKVITTNDIPL